MKFHRITIVISEGWLFEMAKMIKMEQLTSNWMPEMLPAQDLAMTVIQGIKHELDLVVCPHDEELNKILEKIDEENN